MLAGLFSGSKRGLWACNQTPRLLVNRVGEAPTTGRMLLPRVLKALQVMTHKFHQMRLRQPSLPSPPERLKIASFLLAGVGTSLVGCSASYLIGSAVRALSIIVS